MGATVEPSQCTVRGLNRSAPNAVDVDNDHVTTTSGAVICEVATLIADGAPIAWVAFLVLLVQALLTRPCFVARARAHQVDPEGSWVMRGVVLNVTPSVMKSPGLLQADALAPGMVALLAM